MANAQFENIVTVKRVALPKTTYAQTIRIAVKENADHIINCGADSFINSYECMSSEISVFGRTNVRILYCDQSGQVYSANYNADYTDRIQAEIANNDKLCFEVCVADCNAEVSGNVIIVSLLLEIKGYTFVESNMPVMVGGEDIYLKFRDCNLLQHAQCHNLSCDIVEELTASRPINRILCAEGQLCVNKSSIDNDILTIEGDGSIALVYLTQDNAMVCDRLPFVFSEQKDVKGLSVGGQVSVTATVKNTRLRLNVENDVVDQTFTTELAVQLTVISTELNTVSIVEDAYCTKSDLMLSGTTVNTTVPCGSCIANKTIDYTLSGTRGKSVACVNWRVMVTNSTCVESGCDVEGVVSGDIIFSTDDGLVNNHVEIPFAERVEGGQFSNGCTCDVVASVNNIKTSGSGNVLVSVSMCFALNCYRDVQNWYITSAQEQPLDSQKRCAIEVCIAKKGDTLWQLAKGLHMSEEDITTVNPELSSPLQQDTKVVIYNKL